MIVVFEYTSPLGFLGKLAGRVFLKKYMTNLLEKRNRLIKDYTESEEWKLLLCSKIVV